MKNIFVGNLNFNTSEDELRQMFEAYGQVDRVSIMTDRDTGRSRGFGFVEMTSAEDGEKAIAALNGQEIGGRTLNINEARPKTERGPGGGGGGAERPPGRGGRGSGGGARSGLGHRELRVARRPAPRGRQLSHGCDHARRPAPTRHAVRQRAVFASICRSRSRR